MAGSAMTEEYAVGITSAAGMVIERLFGDPAYYLQRLATNRLIGPTGLDMPAASGPHRGKVLDLTGAVRRSGHIPRLSVLIRDPYFLF